MSDYSDHKRDEDFDREDAKSAHATHADRVAFADAMMAPPTREIECPNCGDARIVEVTDDCGCYQGTALCGVCAAKPDPACDSCGDTGRVAVWRMGWNGYSRPHRWRSRGSCRSQMAHLE